MQNAATGLENHLALGLAAPWRRTLLPALAQRGLLCGQLWEWERWVEPQLAKAPFAIESTFDMLWWLKCAPHPS